MSHLALNKCRGGCNERVTIGRFLPSEKQGSTVLHAHAGRQCRQHGKPPTAVYSNRTLEHKAVANEQKHVIVVTPENSNTASHNHTRHFAAALSGQCHFDTTACRRAGPNLSTKNRADIGGGSAHMTW